MQFVRYILIAIIWLGTDQIILSQYYLKVKSDSVCLESDSVLLTVDEYRGEISWHASTDLINWILLNENDDTLGVRIDSSAYYRATITEGTCNPILSDTVFLTEEITVTNSNQFTVDSLGGVFLLPAGIKVKVPRKAVNEPVTVEVYVLDSIAAREEIPFVRDSGRYFIYALRFNPEGFQFQEPIKIKVPGDGYTHSTLPLVHLLDTAGDEWKEYNGNLLCSQKDNFIELVTDSLCPILVDAYPDVFGTQDKSEGSEECRKGLIRINSMTHDLNQIHRSIECFVFQDEGSVEFLDCPDRPKEYWKIREISPDCVPVVDLLLNGDTKNRMIKVGEPAELTFFAHVNGIPLANQRINVALPPGGPEGSLSGYTGEDGHIDFQIIPTGVNLNGEISYVGDFEYCLQLIEASANGVTESACQISPLKKDLFEDSKQIIFYDYCTDAADLDCSQISDPNCPTIRDLLINNIVFLLDSLTIDKGDNLKLMIKAYNYSNEVLTGDFEASWSSSDEAIVFVENGLITGVEKGSAIITAEICNSQTQCVVEVTNNSCDSAKVTVSPLNIKIAKGGQYKINIEYDESADYYTYIPEIDFIRQNDGIASVDEQGVVHGINTGNTEIGVTWCEENVTVEVEVTEEEFCDSVNIGINTNTIHMNVNSQYRINIINYETSSGNLYVPVVEFTSSNNTVATVNSSGIVHAVSEGETEIFVSWCSETRIIPISVTSGIQYFHVITHFRDDREYHDSSSNYSCGEIFVPYEKHYFKNTIISGEFIFQGNDIIKNVSRYWGESHQHDYTYGICTGDCSFLYRYYYNKTISHSDSVIPFLSVNSDSGLLRIYYAYNIYGYESGFHKQQDCSGQWNVIPYEFEYGPWNYSFYPITPSFYYDYRILDLSLTSNDGKTFTGNKTEIYDYQGGVNLIIYSAIVKIIDAYQPD